MRISVDLMKCHGHARCWAVDPDFFTLDEEGRCKIGADKVVPKGQEDRARVAVMSCPEDALSLSE